MQPQHKKETGSVSGIKYMAVVIVKKVIVRDCDGSCFVGDFFFDLV